MLKAEDVKKFARERGADLVGIASIDRFEGAPPDMHPASIFPEAKSVVVFALRIPRGTLRGIEEGTHWNSYTFFSYSRLSLIFLPELSYNITRFIEDHYWEAVPIQSESAPSEMKENPVKAVVPGRTAANVMPSLRFAAVAAGLGEIGYSKVFLSPQFGPRQRIGMVITNAPLKPDPLFQGEICDLCMSCVKDCPSSAISKEKKISINIGGKKVEWGQVHAGRCLYSHSGADRKVSPFIDVDVKAEFSDNPRASYFGGGNKFDLKREDVPFYNQMLRAYNYLAVCGARGCIRACMIHLEETGRIPKFHEPFRKRKAWMFT